MWSFTKRLAVPLSLFYAVCLSSGSGFLDGDSSHQMSFDEMPLLDRSDYVVMRYSSILSAIKKNMDEDSGTMSLHRRLAGDFDDFNDLFRDAVIELPPTTITEKIVFDLTMNLNEIKCTNVNVTDIVITYNKDASNQRLWFQVDVVDLAMNCFIEYDYKYGILSGKGNVKAYSDNNAASVLLSFDSTNFDEAPPTSSMVHNCTADISLNDLDFGGDWISTLLDTFERLIRGKVEEEVRAVACEELSSLGGTLVNEVLQLAADKLEPYLTVLGDSDPLASEKALQVPEDMVLLDFQDTANVIGSWFDAALQEADALLGTVVDDDGSPTGTGSDLGVNVFLRDYVLDDDRAFAVDVADLPLENGGVLFQAHDKLTETTITLDSVKVFGLDTFTRFEALIDIGQYTLQNELTWSYLIMELDVTIDMKASTKPDAIIQGASDRSIVEKVKISFGVDEIDAVVSVLLAIDQEALGSLKLGPMLNTSTLLPCLLSTVFDVEISELSVAVGNIREPTLDDFVSAGIDRIVTQSVEAVFLMYENLLLDAVPNFFATTFRDLVNKEFFDKYMSDPANSQCPPVDDVEGFIDFRDLLLKPDLAAISGGSGGEPYGNLAYTLMTLVTDQLLATEDDGLPSINSVLIGRLTEAQSGVKGMVQFPSELFSLAKDNAMGLQLTVSDLRLRNLDTLTEPLSILQPSNDPHVLSNLMNIGPVSGRPLNGTLRLLVGLDNPDPSLSMMNEMDISASVASSILSADILARINATELMQFPLRDILNMNCWLAKFPAPELDANGIRVDPSDDSSMALLQFFMSLTAFSMDVACIDCRSPGVAVLPDVLNMLEGLGSISLLQARLGYLAQDIVMSNWIQSFLDQMLSKAPKSCPHSAEYDEKAVESELSGPWFPSLSREGVETLIFGAAVAAQVGTVVIAESHSSFNASATDSLSPQNNLEVPEGVRLLDLTKLGSTIGSWVDSAIEKVDGFLNETTDDVGGPNGDTDLGINVFLRDQLLDDRRTFSFNFDGVSIKGDEMEIALKEIRIIGLDTFTTADVLNIIAPQTIENELAWQNLSVELDLLIKTAQSSSSARLLQNGEVLTVSFGVKDVNVSSGLFLALDQDRLGSLTLGSMMNTDRILPCLLSSAYGVEVTELSVRVGEMDSLSFTGFFSEQVDSNIKNLTQSIVAKYGASMIAAVPGIFDVTVRGLINNWIEYYLDLDSSTSCPELDFEPSQSGFIHFHDMFLSSDKSVSLGGTGKSQYGDMFRRLYNLVNEQILQIDETDGTSSMNDLLIAPLTKGASGTEGTIRFEGNLFNTSNRVQVGGLDAKVELKAYDARIENLDSVGEPLFLLDPVLNEPHLLNNTATFGVGPSPLRLGIKFMFALLSDDAQIQNDVDITLDLSSATVAAVALLKIAEDRFTSFPLRDILNIDCWLATLPAPPLDSHGIRVQGAEPSASLKDIAAFIASVDLNITCLNCTSPKIEELAVLLSSKEGGEDATKAVNTILDLATKLLGGGYLSVTIDRLLNEAPKRCPHRTEYQPQPVEAEYEPFEAVDTGDGSTQFLITLMVVIVCVIGAFALVSLAVRWFVRRRHGMWLRSLSDQSITLIRTRQNAQKAKEADINRITTSMFTSTDIPRYVRWLMPLVILGNIAFFLSGHLSDGANVVIEAEIGGQRFSEDKFYEFSMAQSTIDIWNAGGEELAILIAIFSGIWPYTKQLITLALWFCPTRFVSTSRRESTLLWLDTLGKWSFVDIFVLVVCIAAFWVSIESPDVAFLPEGFYSVNLMVVPLWGLYANMIAQLISQVSSHIIIHYHRKMVDSASAQCDRMLQSDTIRTVENTVSEQSDSSQAQVDEPTILRNHAFERPHRGEFDKLQVRRGVNSGLCFVALGVVVSVIVGCILPSISREVLGVLGVAVESGQDFEEAVTYHSVFTLVELLMKEARYLGTAGDYIGLGTLSAVFILSILVVPILQVLTLLRQWFTPLTQKQRRRMSVLTEIFQAWQYVEVFVFAIIVSAWQLGPISDFMINSYCDGFTDTFATLVYYGVLDPADAQCFKVEAGIESATYLLIAAAVLLGVLHTFVVKAVAQYERDASQLHTPLEDAKLGDSESGTCNEEYDESISKIDPVPVLFTDRFRWMMRREDAVVSSGAHRGLDEGSKLGVDDGLSSDEPSTLERSFSEEAGPTVDSESEGRSHGAQELNEGLPVMIDDQSKYGSSVYEDEDASVYRYEEDTA